MDTEAVLEFLAHVPILKKLSTSSHQKIAQVVHIKHYNPGEHIVRKGDNEDGIYFIWDGEAQVHADVKPHSELQLKRYDCFSSGTITSVHEADVIALSKLTCLVLPDRHSSLMTTWKVDDTMCSMLKKILQLDPVDVNIFRGFTLPDTPRFGQVFGGQFIGQALAAASKTVDSLKLVHSFHSYFLSAGNLTIPIIYQVYNLCDGNNFATRRVDATQKGLILFTLLASFQMEEHGFEHQEVTIPSVPTPEMLLLMEDLWEKHLTDPRIPRDYRNKEATKDIVPWPVEMKFCETNKIINPAETPPSANLWFRARGDLSDDQALHRCVVAYISDFIFLSVSLNPHRRKGLKVMGLSLDHSMWFHRPFRADEWLLYVIDSPSASHARGICSGRMFNRKGELVASLAQEGLLRTAKRPSSATNSKL